jgi:hypothetical protein
MKALLIVNALGEAATGLAALASPPTVARLLLGAEVAGAGLVLGRVAGAALVAIGGACWLARNETQGAALRGILAGVLTYDIVVAAVLAHAGLSTDSGGVILWPAVVAHGALAVWCGRCLWGRRNDTGQTVK